MPEITKEELLKINICVAHAQGKNREKPGTYANELNKVLKANNLPNIIIPEDTDTNTQSLHEQQDAGATGVDAQIPEPEPRKSKPSLSRQSSSGELTENHDPQTGKQRDAGELGLQFYTTKSRGWPQNFSCEELIKGIQSNKFKWTYTDKKYTEEQVLRKTQKGEINLSKCWFAVETDEYRKIRSGLVQERSPMEQRDPRLRKTSYN